MGGVQGVLALRAGRLLAVALKAKEEMEEARKRLPTASKRPVVLDVFEDTSAVIS